MEIGCGSGHGTKLILDYLGAGHVDAVDLDPHSSRWSGLRCMGPPVARVLPPRGRVALSQRPDAVAEVPTARVPISPLGSRKQLPESPSPLSRFTLRSDAMPQCLGRAAASACLWRLP